MKIKIQNQFIALLTFIVLTGCSVQGTPAGLGNSSSQIIYFSTAEDSMRSVLQDPEYFKPCQGVPDSNLKWPQEFLYACDFPVVPTYSFPSGVASSPFPLDCDATLPTVTPLPSPYENVPLADAVDRENRLSFYNSVFGVSDILYKRLNAVQYKIALGTNFSVKTDGTGKYLYIPTPITRDLTGYDPTVSIQNNPLILGYNLKLGQMSNRNIIGYSFIFGLFGNSSLMNVGSTPLKFDENTGFPAASFDLTESTNNKVTQRYSYGTKLAFQATDGEEPGTLNRYLCSFFVKNKFYSIQKKDLNNLSQVFGVELNPLADSAGRIRIALPTVYYTTSFKPRTVFRNQFSTGSTAMTPQELPDFTIDEKLSTLNYETSYANLIEQVEDGTAIRELSSEFTPLP